MKKVPSLSPHMNNVTKENTFVTFVLSNIATGWLDEIDTIFTRLAQNWVYWLKPLQVLNVRPLQLEQVYWFCSNEFFWSSSVWLFALLIETFGDIIKVRLDFLANNLFYLYRDVVRNIYVHRGSHGRISWKPLEAMEAISRESWKPLYWKMADVFLQLRNGFDKI